MPLKNIKSVRETFKDESIQRVRIIDADGDYINSCDVFHDSLLKSGYSAGSILRYSYPVPRFVDYLIEMEVLGKPTSSTAINRAIDLYPIYLKHGISVNAGNHTKLLRTFAEATGFGSGLSRNSFAPELAALNLFLDKSQYLADEANEVARGLDPNITDKYELVIAVINGSRTISAFEKKRLQQNSMLGGVIRICGPIQRPKRLSSALEKAGQTDEQHQDFPLAGFAAVLEAATCWRDKALWALLMATGIRKSEALNLRLAHIDPILQEIWVFDPRGTRFGGKLSQRAGLKFKGRATAETNPFEPLKSIFFKYYEKYLKEEFVCTAEHDFAFQILSKPRRGAPLHTASDTAINKSFAKAVRRAKVPGPPNQPDKVWTLHSLRHAYGVYMLNHIPVPNGFGLRPTLVQMAMGHRNLASTLHYARHDQAQLDAAMKYSSDLVFGAGEEIEDISTIIGKQFLSAANALLAGSTKI